MTNEEKTVILEGAQKVFFEAMLDGYAGGENPKSTKTIWHDGYTTITFINGDFKVVDHYCTTRHSDKSAGTTTIFHSENCIWVPVWWMSYGGHYPKAVIPLLKAAMRANYERGVFNGGRGPSSFPVPTGQEKVVYTNHFYGDFASFNGEEFISSFKPNKVGRIGFHKYFGMSLL